MSIKQVSLFVQSRPGHMKRYLDLMSGEGINVRGYSCSDTGDYGIVRFVVDDPDRALALFTDKGLAVASSDVVGVKLADTPGELARVFGIISDSGQNIAYSYSLISTFIAFKVEDAASVESLLTANGIELLDQSDLR